MILVIGDYNAKIGEGRENKTVGPHGLETRNDRGIRLIEFATKHKVFLSPIPGSNRKGPQDIHCTWTSLDDNTKNQIDYILASQRYRNTILNSKVYPGADCSSGHCYSLSYTITTSRHTRCLIQSIMRIQDCACEAPDAAA